MKSEIVVDCSKKLGTYTKTHVNNNWCDSHHFHESYYDDLEFLKENGIEFDKFRIWINPNGWYDLKSEKYRFERYYRYLEGASRVANTILVNTGSPLKDISLDKYRDILKTGLKFYKEKFPKIKYIECLNEVDLEKTLNEEQYYEYYKLYYTVINEINMELKPEIPLQVGGIAVYRFDSHWLKTFLDYYKMDTNSNKRLDFLSYHQYGRQDEVLIREEIISAVGNERGLIEEWLKERGLSTDIPSFITEIGVFPGANGTEDVAGDLLTQAAGMAAMNYYYLTSSECNVPFQWAVRHKTNERKDMLVKDKCRKLTPYGNVLKMMSMLKDQRIDARSDSLTAGGIGLGGMATSDQSGISVMLWNYQWTKTEKADYETTIKIENLPEIFKGRSIRVKRYLVDAVHSNYVYDMTTANLQKVEDVLVVAAGAYTESFVMGKNAVCLLELTPEYSEFSGTSVYSWSMKESGAVYHTEGIDDDNYDTYVDLETNGAHIQFDLGSVKTVESLDVAFYDGHTKSANFDIKIYSKEDRENGTFKVSEMKVNYR